MATVSRPYTPHHSADCPPRHADGDSRGHHLCSTTAETILRLFEQNGTRCRIVAELWSFENIKSFVQEEVGMAFVPGITVRQELRDGTLVRIPLRELAMPRRTLMIYREQGYVSDTARELIKIVRAFNWDQGFSDKQALRSPIATIEPAELRNRMRRNALRISDTAVRKS